MEKLTDLEKDTLKMLPGVIEVMKGLSPNSEIGPATVKFTISELEKLEESLRYINKIRYSKPH